MIVTLTPNPAVDVTYTVPQLQHGRVHRVQQVVESAGGKGVNVARVLAALGRPVCATGFLGGAAGETLEDLLLSEPVEQAWTLVSGQTRRTVNVVDERDATIFNERGPQVTSHDWGRLTAGVLARLAAGDVLAVSGSTPPGTGDGDLSALVRSAVELGAAVVADTSGPGLLEVAAAGPACLKPNEEELLAATGAADVLTGARSLLARGAEAVLVSRGADGVLLVTGEEHWAARPAETLTGNPTGAGDAAVAALAVALADGARGADLSAHLGEVVALSGAAVLRPTAGEVDLEAYARMLPTIQTEEIDAAS
ncbi:MAG TPA: 1-phosphofructokinase family hexose kinase [Candidatus Ruania gallistercoris]|uniref:1-phosphofructokinase family hexose kinase n=1 Tax=Candidatus Ruania gallistercoris TaxID=2838746 RepID=A0A9D2EBJ1_9MICO|nr:1-phosphofructokinase family hexose kinase [Candidatus Ruania gallistercoris]